MITEHREILVKQSKQQVFDFLNDDTKLSKWIKGIVKIEPVGEIKEGLGAAVKITVNIPSEGEIISTVVDWDPPNKIALQNDVKNFSGKVVYTLKETDEGTLISFDAEHYPSGFWMQFFSPLTGLVIKHLRKKEMIRLAEALAADSKV